MQISFKSITLQSKTDKYAIFLFAYFVIFAAKFIDHKKTRFTLLNCT